MAIVEALARFIENPNGTLTLKLTPRGKVPVMPLIQALKTDPLDRAGAVSGRGFDAALIS